MDKSTSINRKVINKTIIILGDSKVGKTSFIKRYVENNFKENYYETLGNKFYFFYLNITSNIIYICLICI